MKKGFAKILLGATLLIGFFEIFGDVVLADLRTDLQVDGGTVSANASVDVNLQDNFLKTIQIYMMGLAGIVSVAVFLYIGYTLFTAQGNEEEFKKAWKALIYAVIGLAVMPLAYIAVKIVTGFTL